MTPASGGAASPWSRRLLEAFPAAPVWVGLVLGVLLVAAYALFEFASGRFQAVVRGDLPSVTLRAPLTAMALLAYLSAAQLYLARWTERHVDALRAHVPHLPAGRLYAVHPSRLMGWIGFLTFLFVFFLGPTQTRSALLSGQLAREDLVALVAVPLLGWMMFRFLHAAVADSIWISRLGPRIGTLSLLDPEPLSPFVQQGLRSSLLIVLLLSLSSNLIVAPAEQHLIYAAVQTAAAVLAASAALFLPLRGARVRLGAEKRAQLEPVRRAIEEDRVRVLKGSADATEAAARLPGLIALEARIAAVREWPLDASSVGRFALYLLVGLASWIGAAGVERLLDIWLD